MRGRILGVAALAAVSLALSAEARAEHFTAKASGFLELGVLNNETGAIFSEGTGKLSLDVDRTAQTATYTLTFSGLSSPVLQAHLHFAKIHVPGGIIVFLCTNLANNPAGTPTPPACPANGGTVTGTLSAANVIGVPSQNFPAGNFDAFVDMIQSNTSYLNIHTNNFKAGEIRGEVRHGEGDEE